jgi:hypothetical protein
MTATYQTLISDSYLRAILDKDFQVFRNSAREKALIARLEGWSDKAFQKETSAEIAFVNLFFEQTWGYTQSGKSRGVPGYTCYPKFPVTGAGAGGGSGEADAALGFFGHPEVPPTPQEAMKPLSSVGWAKSGALRPASNDFQGAFGKKSSRLRSQLAQGLGPSH